MRQRLPILVGGLGILVIAATLLAAPRTATVEGVVVSVRSTSLADVSSFTIRTSDGMLIEFGLEALENGAEFPPGHLTEHAATSAPVVVTYRDVAGRHLAIRIVDAPVGSST